MANKTPYELRVDLLNIAFGILDAQASVKDSRSSDGTIIREAARPGVEEVIKAAEKMNQFVSHGKCECPDCECDPCNCDD